MLAVLHYSGANSNEPKIPAPIFRASNARQFEEFSAQVSSLNKQKSDFYSTFFFLILYSPWYPFLYLAVVDLQIKSSTLTLPLQINLQNNGLSFKT